MPSNLSRCDMAIDGAKDFRLSVQVQDEVLFKLLTKLPTADFFKKIDDELPPYIRFQIKQCFEYLYSHVVQRTPDEGAEYMFHHVASSVHYEIYTGTRIKDRDHITKAANIFMMLKNTIEAVEAQMGKQMMSAAQIEFLMLINKVFYLHRTALVDALQQAPQDVKESLEKHYHIKVDSLKNVLVSPNSKLQALTCYPKTPDASPVKAGGNQPPPRKTPKKLSSNDIAVKDYLNPKPEMPKLPAQRCLDFPDISVLQLDDAAEHGNVELEMRVDSLPPPILDYRFQSEMRRADKRVRKPSFVLPGSVASSSSASEHYSSRSSSDSYSSGSDDDDWLERSSGSSSEDDFFADLQSQMDKKAGFGFGLK